MSLQDLIREFTLEVRDGIRLHEARLSKAKSDLAAVRQRAEVCASEVKGKQEVVEDRKRRAAALEGEMEEARRRLEEKRKQLEEAQEEVHEGEELAGKLRKDRKVALGEAENLDKAVRELAEERDGFDVTLSRAHRDAFRRYTADLQAALAEFASQQEGRQAKLARLQKLRDARHNDPVVGNLCEAREELRRLLKTTRVPTVKDALQSQLTGIEAKLDKLFPGALEADTTGAANSEEIQELFFAQDENHLHTRIFLPFDKAVWESIRSGTDGMAETTASHVAWTFAKELGLNSEDAGFGLLAECGIVILRVPFDDKLSEKDIVVKLPEVGSVTFMFSPLPEPVQKAIGDDHENE